MGIYETVLKDDHYRRIVQKAEVLAKSEGFTKHRAVLEVLKREPDLYRRWLELQRR